LWCFLAIGLSTTVAYGQGKTPPPPPQPLPAPIHSSVPSEFDQAKVAFDSDGKPAAKTLKDDNCFLPPLNSLQIVTAGVADLQVQSKSQHEFDQGCSALRSKKVTDAEAHLRKALKQDEKFSAAWVLLGQVLEAQQKMDEAREACSHPTATSNYVPAFLCLADLSAHAKQWDDVLKLSTRALEIDPSTDAPAYAYNAAANLNLHHLAEAEKSALRAVDIDRSNKDPRVHFLLAQIYEAKGDPAGEAAQLREYLKYTTDPQDAAMVKSYLAALDGQSSK
jgi:tetratricopeptide (TPR) repeat protein